MTTAEMQRFLAMELERGCSELEAYRNLMIILDIKLPIVAERKQTEENA